MVSQHAPSADATATRRAAVVMGPAFLVDFEISRELADPGTCPDRRAQLAAVEVERVTYRKGWEAAASAWTGC